MEAYTLVSMRANPMMTSNRLLFNRVKQNIMFTYNIYKVVFDWTIIVYLVLPALIISGAIYYSWWSQGPVWLQFVPLELFLVIYFCLTWMGHFRTYVRRADQIYLAKNIPLQLSLKQKGMILSAGKQIVTSLFLAGIFAPFWLMFYQKSILSLVSLSIIWITFKWVIMGVKGEFQRVEKGWKRYLLSAVVLICSFIVWSNYISYSLYDRISIAMLISCLHLFLAILVIKRRWSSVRTFSQDLQIEESEKVRQIKTIFSLAQEMDKPPQPMSYRKKPRTFSKSQRIFKRRTVINGFLELFIKGVIRNIGQIIGITQIIGVTSGAIFILPPLWMKIFFAIAGYIFLHIWFNAVWERMIGTHPFTKRFADYPAYFQARFRAAMVLSIPYILVISSSFFFWWSMR